MPTSPKAHASPCLSAVLGRLGGQVASGAGWSDGELLARFLDGRDGDAFAVLVRRHGPMVLGVCRRLTGHAEDAEDAFQATFLVLARRAGSVVPRERVANWLFGVARRTALKARSLSFRRRAREKPLEETVSPAFVPAEQNHNLQGILDQELSRLPERHRLPILMCDLEGLPLRDVARQLSWPVGTLSNRLTAARRTLAQRLTRRGVGLVGGLMAALVAARASANVCPLLAASTARLVVAGAGEISARVAALTEGVIRAMMLTKIKLIAATVLPLALLTAGVAMLTRPAEARPPVTARADQPKDQAKKETGPTIQGTVTNLDTRQKPAKVTIRVLKDPSKKETEEKTLPVAADAKFVREDVTTKVPQLPAGELTDLTEGTRVTLQLDPTGKTVVGVSARAPVIHGHVKSFDASRNMLTFAVKEDGGLKEYSLELGKEAKIILDDGLGKKGDAPVEGKASDLMEGVTVQVQPTVSRKTALEVRVQGASLLGTVKGYDAGNRLLTLTVKEDGQIVDKGLTLAEGARIEGDLTAGNLASVRLSVKDKTVAVGVNVIKK